MLKGVAGLFGIGVVVAGAAALVLTKKKKEDDEIIYASKKVFNESSLDIPEGEEEAVEVIYTENEKGDYEKKVEVDSTHFVDTNEDGKEDSASIDLDGDGIADIEISLSSNEEALKEENQKSTVQKMKENILSKLEETEKEGIYISDANGDGMVDTIVADTNGDGKVDTALVDTNGDGQLDTSINLE